MAEEEKQKPEKVKKKSKGLSLPIMIGIGVIALAVLIGGILFGVNIMINSVLDARLAEVNVTDGEGGEKDGEHGDKEHDKEHSDEEHEEEMDPEEMAEDEFFNGDEGVSFKETGRVITNPKGSTQFVVVNLGLVIREKGEGEEGHEESEEGELSLKEVKMNAQVKHVINTVIGNLTLAELQEQRNLLTEIFKAKLKPVYQENGIWLREVVMVEFIIQT